MREMSWKTGSVFRSRVQVVLGHLQDNFTAILVPISSTQLGPKFHTNDLEVLNSPFQQYNGIRLLFGDNLGELAVPAAADDCFVGFTSFTVAKIFQQTWNNKAPFTRSISVIAATTLR